MRRGEVSGWEEVGGGFGFERQEWEWEGGRICNGVATRKEGDTIKDIEIISWRSLLS